MLRSTKDLHGFAISAQDGEIGSVHDIFFDANQWTVRYFVVDTGPWLLGRRVLIAPVAVKAPNWDAHVLPVELTKEQVKDSPDVDTDRPITRQVEIETHDYYRWPYYWGGGGLIGSGAFIGVAPEAFVVGDANPRPLPHTEADVQADSDRYLYSARDVMGYKIGATDDDFGSVDDLLIEDDSWVIRYMVIDTGGLLQPHKRFLVAPPWIEYVSWQDRKVHIDLPRGKIESAPQFDETRPVDREYEGRLHEHYGVPEYWREPTERRR